MASEWQPTNEVETRLLAAIQGGDQPGFLAILAEADLFLPISPEAAAGTAPVAWATAVLEGRTQVIAFTSPAAMVQSTRGVVQNCRSTPFRALAAAWPNPQWDLALDPLLPLESYLAPGDVVRLATRPLIDALLVPANTPSLATVVQKPLTLDQLVQYLQDNDHRVAGYVHRLEDVAHLNTPAKVVEGLGLSYPDSPFAVSDEFVFAVRWPIVGAELFRPPYGGVDVAAMRGMDGWVIEAPPFTGTGFVPVTTPPIQEYKVESMRLPHGAEIYRFDRDAIETLVAIYDADRDGWLLVDHEADQETVEQ